MPSFDRHGIRFHYEVRGSGRPVVICHGLGADCRAPIELVGEATGCRLIVWDCRGHGETRPVGPAEMFGFGPMAEDLSTLLDHLGVTRAIIGGISMGAAIATRFAIQWPERVEALILIRPAWLTEPMPNALALLPRVADLLRRHGPDRGLAEFQTLPELAAVRARSPALADSLCERFHEPEAVQRAARLERLPADCPVNDWNALASLTMPALVVGTEFDLLHPMEYARTWAAHLPRAVLAQIPPKADDFACHAAEFRRHLADFLTALNAGPAP